MITGETGGGQSVLGRLDQTRSLGERAVTYSSFRGGIAAHALHLLGEIASHPDRFDTERGALALAEPRGMRPLVAHGRFGLWKLYRRTGKLEQARASPRVPHHGNGEVPRDGYAVLAEQAETATKDSGESRETYRVCCLLFASCSIATTRSWSSPLGTSLRKLSHAFTAPA